MSVEERMPAAPSDTVAPMSTRRDGRLLATVLAWGLLVTWAATVWIVVLVADGLGADRAHPKWWAHVLAAGLVVVTVAPLRRWLQRGIDDVVYGQHDDALAVVTRLNRQLDSGAPVFPGDEGSSIATTIARTLGVPFVAIVEDGVETSVAGRRPSQRNLTMVPLVYHDQPLGHVDVGLRRPGAPLSRRDLELLGDLARHLSVGMFALRASAQIQASRSALVSAREEERRRIRRDLHDGLGPSLAAMKLQLVAAQRLLHCGPARSSAILDEVRGQMNQTTSEIRRLVYGLRPPLLDDLGLAGALRNHPGSHAGVMVTVSPEIVPPLPAAVEVALYRIVTEAIHNTVRHSGARRCHVTIDVRELDVVVAIADDGRGLPEPLVAGVGITAMRERAAELGGSVRTGHNDEGGATVTTVVPLNGSTG